MSYTPLSAAAPESAPGPRPGLRERNKARTRNAIRAAAMDLFEKQGYTTTTVAQIADAAEVSHTTFFRYFQSKEQVVLADDLDERRNELLHAIAPGLDRFDLVRRIIVDLYQVGVNDEWAANKARLRLVQTEPALVAAQQAEADRALVEMRGFIGAYLGVSPDDLRLRVFIAACVGALFHVVGHTGDGEIPTLEECLEALDLLEAGLPV
ncbi:TetR family transcriptional regulator [Gordonia humi]|uniref:AcrR family transcriptional regulator n=1 Tax=Gordonia humi TaxID=686429 RepID=A0A840F5A8_9ACTN|nr:TetR family transcriptional regulator [Gordonia humi]MBB4135440.1 AcrR family transcriptional regulator [Gordonia humi]